MNFFAAILIAIAALVGSTAVPLDAASEFPMKGKAISLIVPFPAGGSTDVSARILGGLMEKELGTPVQIVNKAGAGSQIGITELVHAKADGYTIGYTLLPATVAIYLDPDRKAVFGRKDLQLIGMHVSDPQFLAVSVTSPYRSVKELLDAAKANPGKLKGVAVGILGPEHLAMLQLEQLLGLRFSKVTFDGSAPALTATLGGHVDFQLGTLGVFASAFKANKVRFLAVLDKEESRLVPGIKTMESQGYKLYSYVSRVVSAPAGLPKPILDTLAKALQRTMESEEHKKQIETMGMTLRFMGPEQAAQYWDEVETQIRPLMSLGKQ